MRIAAQVLSCLTSILFCCSLPLAGASQSQTAANANSDLRFEVATIKVHNPNVPSEQGVQVEAGGRVRIIAVNFKTLVRIALNCPFWAISGDDGSIGKLNYDVQAIPPENMRSSITNLKHTWYTIDDPRLRQMLTALLVDRFHLKYHRETKTGTIYILERTNKPLRLIASGHERRDEKGELIDAGFGSIGLAGRWDITDASMAQLANFASDFILHAPVQDQTHLQGTFHYRSNTLVDMSDPDVHTSSFIGFISELGLRLKKSQGPVETIVIDHAEKPSEN